MAVSSFALARRFNEFKLKVQNANDTGTPTENMVTLDTKTVVMNFDKNSEMFVGGVPAGKKVPSEITSKKLSASLENVAVDGQTTGLWNWKVSCVSSVEFPRIEGHGKNWIFPVGQSKPA